MKKLKCEFSPISSSFSKITSPTEIIDLGFLHHIKLENVHFQVKFFEKLILARNFEQKIQNFEFSPISRNFSKITPSTEIVDLGFLHHIQL